MAIKIWTALGVGRETDPADLSSQRQKAAQIRRRTAVVGKRDRKHQVRASRERRRMKADREAKPKPAPRLRAAQRGAEL